MERFQNREEAGRLLGEKLLSYKNQHPVILAVPRGGVPVAFEVAKLLNCPLDLIMVKKIGAPKQPELAVGAVSEDSIPIYNKSLVRALSLKHSYLDQVAKKKIKEVHEQLKEFRGTKIPENIKNRTVILIDDGIATGATLMAAIQFIRQKEPLKIVVASPVGSKENLQRIKKLADDVICLKTPDPFMSVGLWYENFNQVSNEEVIRLLGDSRFLAEESNSEIVIQDAHTELHGELHLCDHGKDLIVLTSGSELYQHNPRCQTFKEEFLKSGFNVLLLNLYSEKEIQNTTSPVSLATLSRRLILGTEAAITKIKSSPVSVGYFAMGVGAGAALAASAQSARKISAIVSFRGRPDMAEEYWRRIETPVLFIAGENDTSIVSIHNYEKEKLRHAKSIAIPHTTYFEEFEPLSEAVEYSLDWFTRFLLLKVSDTPAQEKVVFEMEQKAHKIQNEHSWDELIKTLSNSRVVMLGESTHGTQEFYNIRRAISERLIQEHGFKFIAVEGDWPDCQKLNDYIRFDKGSSAQQIMKEFHRWPTWMWANDETSTLIEWMKNYRTGFYGLDVYSLFESMDLVIDFAKKVDPELAAAVQERYACFDPFERDEKSYAQHLVKFPEGCRHDVMSALRKTLRLRLEDLSITDPELFNAQQNARIVAHAEHYYRAMLFGGPESWNVRDQHMIETLDLLLKKEGPQSKCIVWAHNSHIGDYHATEMASEGYINLGGLARERFGIDQVALVGFGTYEGKVFAGPSWEGKGASVDLPPARTSSFEYFCHKVAEDLRTKRFYLIFDSEDRQGCLGRRSYGHRAVGVVYQPEFEKKGHNYVKTIPAKRYDAFVFVDKTSALIPLPTKTSHLDLPETWPGGL